MKKKLFLFAILGSSFSFGIKCPSLWRTLFKIGPIHPVSAYRHMTSRAPQSLRDLEEKIGEEGFEKPSGTYQLGKNEYVMFFEDGKSPVLVKVTKEGGYISDNSGITIGYWNAEKVGNFKDFVAPPVPAAHQKEVESLREKATSYEVQRQKFWDTISFAPRLLFYPHVVTFRVARAIITGGIFDGRRIIKATFGRILRDGVAVYGYYLLIDTGTHPSLVFLEIMEKHDGTVYYPYLSKTPTNWVNTAIIWIVSALRIQKNRLTF